jgi:hypothetical protein
MGGELAERRNSYKICVCTTKRKISLWISIVEVDGRIILKLISNQ